MLGFASARTIHLALEPVDMRKQFDGLWTVASQVLREDPLGGALFVFTNKRRNRVKLLFWDGSESERGPFSLPQTSLVPAKSSPFPMHRIIVGLEELPYA